MNRQGRVLPAWRLAALAAALVLASPAPPAMAEGAGAFVTRLLREADDVERSVAAARLPRLRAMLRRHTDIAEVARFIAGRHWARMTEAQRARLADLYGEYVVHAIAGRISKFRPGSFALLEQRTIPPDDTLVTTRIAAKSGREHIVRWRVRGGRRLVDVFQEGASMAATHRSEFAGMVAAENGDFESVLRRFEERVRQIRAAPD